MFRIAFNYWLEQRSLSALWNRVARVFGYSDNESGWLDLVWHSRGAVEMGQVLFGFVGTLITQALVACGVGSTTTESIRETLPR